ncbi:hypothetical protein ACFWN1_33035 [Streptomyces sp. NPDC058459]|uniref:hypothetical protein n=1 Tax=Streptomyces sp. NPDC058459 TaxID=3346508 RepID=UPI0036620158
MVRGYLHAHLTRLRDIVGETPDAEDVGTLAILLEPGAPEGLLNRPDAFPLSATAVSFGVRPA